jgi:DNA-binding NarL/FixJ family response regulator
VESCGYIMVRRCPAANGAPRIVQTRRSAELEKRYASSHFGGRRPSNREARVKDSAWRSAEWEIIDEAEDGIEAVEKADRLKPDVVVLDVSMPRMDGLEACRRIRKSVPKSEVLIVTQHDSPQMMREALGAGARGYIVKSDAARDLLAALEAVSQHRPFIAQNRGQVNDSE